MQGNLLDIDEDATRFIADLNMHKVLSVTDKKARSQKVTCGSCRDWVESHFKLRQQTLSAHFGFFLNIGDINPFQLQKLDTI